MSDDLWNEALEAVEPFLRLGRLADFNNELQHIKSIKSRRCGSCFWWMKSRDCPRERNVNGYSRGPSMNSTIALRCSKYQLAPLSKQNYETRLLDWQERFNKAFPDRALIDKEDQ